MPACLGGTSLVGFVCETLDPFPAETVKPQQCWMVFLEDLLLPNGKEYLSVYLSIYLVFPVHQNP